MVTTIHGFSSSAHPARLPALGERLRLDLRLRSRTRARVRRDGPSRRRHRGAAVLAPTAGDGLVCFGRIHPDKGTAQAIEIARARRTAARALRPGAGRALLRRGGRAARRRRPCSLPRIRGPRGTRRDPGGGRPVYCTPSRSPSRSACRSSSRCSAARRSSPTPAARCRRLVEEGVTGVLVARRRRRRSRASSALPRFDRAACRRTAERRFSVDRMVDDYLDVYESVLRDR